MSRLPSLTPREVVSALKRAGFEERRQRGSHLILWHGQRELVVTVPLHTSDLPRGTLKAILRQSGLTEEEFMEFL